MSSVDTPAIGHNSIANLDGVLRDQYSSLEERTLVMLEKLESAPEPIERDEDAGLCSDAYGEALALWKDAEAIRVKEKAPFLEGGGKVDSYFNEIKKRIADAGKLVHDRVTAWNIAKRREEERKARARQEELDRIAREARERAEAEERRAAEARAAAERSRKAETQAAAEARADVHDNAAEAARARAESAAEEARVAEERSRRIPKEDTRTRGRATQSNIRDVPAFEVLDYELIPPDRLWPYIDRIAIDKALKAFLTVQKSAALAGEGTSAIPGVRFFLEERGQIRR
jgi:hypothetical protein